MNRVSRRGFIVGGTVGAVAGSTLDAGAAAPSPPPPSPAAGPAPASGPAGTAARRFFTAPEAAVIAAAVTRLIPPDDIGPGAVEAGVPEFIDLQLAGAWGAGERLYRSGPWHAGTPTQGYQLPFTPAELYRTALRGLQQDLQRRHQPAFEALSGVDQDAYLTLMQTTRFDLGGVPSDVFFQSLLDMSIEGYFGDPAYGGNRDMAAWRMIGFPGAYGSYYELVDRHGLAFAMAPISLAETRGHVHLMPDIPAVAPTPLPLQDRKR